MISSSESQHLQFLMALIIVNYRKLYLSSVNWFKFFCRHSTRLTGLYVFIFCKHQGYPCNFTSHFLFSLFLSQASPRSPLSLVWYHCPMVLFCIAELQACDPPPLHFSNNPSLPLFSFCTSTVFVVGESCVWYIQGNGVHFNNTHKAKT